MEPHHPIVDFLHQVVTPMGIGLFLSLLKLLAQRKLISLEEANSTSLDLVAAALGALSIFYYKGRTADAITLAAAGDAICIGVLCVIMSFRIAQRDKIKAAGKVPGPVRWWVALLEIGVGIFGVYWAIKAP